MHNCHQSNVVQFAGFAAGWVVVFVVFVVVTELWLFTATVDAPPEFPFPNCGTKSLKRLSGSFPTPVLEPGLEFGCGCLAGVAIPALLIGVIAGVMWRGDMLVMFAMWLVGRAENELVCGVNAPVRKGDPDTVFGRMEL